MSICYIVFVNSSMFLVTAVMFPCIPHSIVSFVLCVVQFPKENFREKTEMMEINISLTVARSTCVYTKFKLYMPE